MNDDYSRRSGPRHGGRENGHVSDNQSTLEQRLIGMEELDDETRIALLEDAHDFPGYFKITVIAHSGEAFADRLRGLLDEVQGDDPYTVEPRPSRHGTYVSYRVEVHVENGRVALERKDTLAEMDGVLTLL